jgi:hypothetical protein
MYHLCEGAETKASATATGDVYHVVRSKRNRLQPSLGPSGSLKNQNRPETPSQNTASAEYLRRTGRAVRRTRYEKNAV